MENLELEIIPSPGLALLMQARSYSSYIYSSKMKELRLASIVLVKALVDGNQLDLKVPVSDDKDVSHLPLPAALSTIQNPHVECVRAWAEIDPQCLAVQTSEGPSFKTAVMSSLERMGNRVGNNKDVGLEDEMLAEWARHIPAFHCEVFDNPGDDPGAGLLARLRQIGHYPKLEEELAKKGFDLDSRLADGTPTSTFIYFEEQWNTWLEAGGDPDKIVPETPNHPAMTVWEFHGLFNARALLPSISKWAGSQENRPSSFMKRLEGLNFWDNIDLISNHNNSRDVFVSSLKEIPGWTERVDDYGRNVLMRTIAHQPPFLTTCLKTNKFRNQLKSLDNKGRGIWYYALPALQNYSRGTDAKNLANELNDLVPATLRQVDGDRERGLLLSLIMKHKNNPEKEPKKYGSFSDFPLPLSVLIGGSKDDQDEVADYLLSKVDTASPSIPLIAKHFIAEIKAQLKGGDEVEISPALRAVVAYLFLCPCDKSPGYNYSGSGTECLISRQSFNLINEWLVQGVSLPVLNENNGEPMERLRVLKGLWEKPGMITTEANASSLRELIPALLQKFSTYEEHLMFERQTAPAQSKRLNVRL